MTNDQLIQRLKDLASSEGEDGVVEQGMYSEVVEHSITNLIGYWVDMMRGGCDLREMIHEDIAGVITGLQAVRDAALAPEPCYEPVTLGASAGDPEADLCHRLAGHTGDHADVSPDECLVEGCACTEQEE